MERPALVADCVAAMIAESQVPVTVKCRIGVDDQQPEQVLPDFLETVSAAGVTHFIIHARKAWLKGLSPKENRDIPPLDYPLVLAVKQTFPHLTICINGGITSLDQARGFLDQGLDGVMLGRAAYHDPAGTLIGADALWGDGPGRDAHQVVDAMRPYIAQHLAAGGRLRRRRKHGGGGGGVIIPFPAFCTAMRSVPIYTKSKVTAHCKACHCIVLFSP
jgi:tRNA-dihydrouridine synthase A